MLSCKETTRLVSQGLDRDLGFAERVALRSHLVNLRLLLLTDAAVEAGKIIDLFDHQCLQRSGVAGQKNRAGQLRRPLDDARCRHRTQAVARQRDSAGVDAIGLRE